jgi:branched-chain amino acid transport system substrate-binding protein
MQELFQNTKELLGCVLVTATFACASLVQAQQNHPPVPYASIGANGVTYAGPGREASYNLKGPTIHIGLLAPMHGSQQADGEAIVRAAEMALEDAQCDPLPGGLHLALSIGDESGPAWGRVTDALLRLVFKDRAVGIITSASGTTAHLSEQVGNKIGVPILTLSTDATTTQINLPWIFRLGPSDAQQARVIAQDIYRTRDFRHVLLVTECDHDGRMGGREFIDAARELDVPAPSSLAIDPLRPDAGSLLDLIQTQPPQAIVFWTTAETAKKLLEAVRAAGVHTPVYLSQEAAQEGSGLKFRRKTLAGVKDPAGVGIYTVASAMDENFDYESFARRYQAQTGALPSPVAAEAYDAVRLVARAVREAGPNRARVRDNVSSVRNFAGVSGTVSFDDQGDNRAKVRLIRLQ